ncbi:MAG: hypothetical protein A3I38_02420 [Candidatus Wildermuthbacteria bacterium RIFCSPLOWO2_02_FULL_47_10]|nr:MAG: hypothetical protein A3I38_02420 [Candidatus Wildermuthbacteria bacterium RIFCSPLOWO2_02_FULL_47_10]
MIEFLPISTSEPLPVSEVKESGEDPLVSDGLSVSSGVIGGRERLSGAEEEGSSVEGTGPFEDASDEVAAVGVLLVDAEDWANTPSGEIMKINARKKAVNFSIYR